jgi:hypothetical protein
VCEVHEIEGDDLQVSGPMYRGEWAARQWVAISSCKVAKCTRSRRTSSPSHCSTSA